ncbi:hypothetical protein ODQ68_27005, partial [Escherichia coli]|nr:hypothetical protein [Escherichia coli]
PGPVFHTIVSIKNDGHYFCRAGGNRPDGLNEPVTISPPPQRIFFAIRQEVHLSVAAGVISPLTGLGCFVVLPLTGGPE